MDALRKVIEDAEKDGIREGGTVTMVFEGQITGVKAWGGSPMLVVMESFGMPFEHSGYAALVANVRSLGEHAPKPEMEDADVFVSPTEPRRMAIVQTQEGMTLEQAEEFLRSKRS